MIKKSDIRITCCIGLGISLAACVSTSNESTVSSTGSNTNENPARDVQANALGGRVPASQHSTSQSCIEIIEDFEGVRLDSYEGPSGTWLIGYGHSADVVENMQITPQQAENLLREDLVYFETRIADSVSQPISENEFSAMVCLMYNIGEGNFANSTVLREINNQSYDAAADAFLMWNRVNGQVNDHQSSRRERERMLFLD